MPLKNDWVNGDLFTPAAANDMANAVNNAKLVFNVKDYGATGLGTFTAPDTTLAQYATRETNAIHAARNAAGAGGKLFFPAGTYLVSGLTASVANQTWELADGATIKMATGAANCLRITADDVTIDGGVFDASNGTLHDDSQHGIFVYDSSGNADGVTIRNVEVRNSPGNGIYNVQGNRFTVTGCRVIDSYYSSIFTLNGTSGTMVSDIVVTDNHVESSFNSATGLGVLGGSEALYPNCPVQRIKISRNTVILPPPGPVPTSTIGVINCQDWVISNNICVGSELGISNGNIVRGVISNNTVRNFKGVGIEISGDVNGCTVSGNVLDLTGGNSHTLTFSGSPTGGNFTLSYGGFTTGAITYSTTAATTAANIQAALVALTSIGAGNATVTVSSATVFTASIINTAGTLALGTSSLTGGTSPTLAIVASGVNGILGASGSTNTVKRLNIVGNSIFGFANAATGIALSRVSGTASLTLATIADNVIQANCSEFKGVAFGLPVSNLTVSGNTFDAQSTAGVRGVEIQQSVSNATITGNTFKTVSAPSGTYGISLNGVAGTSSGVTVAGNTFTGGSSVGFSALGSNFSASNVTFTGNSVNGETATFTSGIEIYGAVNGMTVSGNQLTNLNQAVVRLLTSTAVTVQNITVGGNNLVNVANRIANSTSGSAVVAATVISADSFFDGIEVGHASDTTLSRSAAGVLAVEGVAIPTISSTSTLENKTISLGSNTVTGTLAQFNTAVTDANLARTDAANTFTGIQTMTSPAITTPTGIVKGDVGLGNVDNTTDVNKPISTATQTAINIANSLGWPGGQVGESIAFGGTVAQITGQGEARLIFTPYWAPRATPISRIAVYVWAAGSAGSVVRVGAYNDDNGIPGTLIFDAGTISSTTAFQDREITTSQTLPAGRFWLAAVVQGGADTLATLAGTNTSNAWNTNAMLLTQGDGYGLDTVYFSLCKFSVSGALPNPAFSSRSLSGGGAGNVGYSFRVKLA
jgi:hypothetical protein